MSNKFAKSFLNKKPFFKKRDTIVRCFKCKREGHYANECGKKLLYKSSITHAETVCDEDEITKEPSCVACSDTGTAYWSDGIYGACMNCERGNKRDLYESATWSSDDEKQEEEVKDEKPAASLEVCGSTMLSVNPEKLKPGFDIRNLFGNGAKK
jgi:hypothetical protein